MHSRIFYLTEEKEQVIEGGNLSESMFYDSDTYGHFVGSIADYVAMVDEDKVEDDVTWGLDHLTRSSNKMDSSYDGEVRYIKLSRGFKEEYMTPILEEIKRRADKLTLEDLVSESTLNVYGLEKAINSKFGFYYILDGYGLCTEQEIIKYMEIGRKYYIGNEVIDYHF